MEHNLEYLISRPGGLKLTTIVLGLVAAILNSHSYANSPYTDFYEDEVLPKNNTFNSPGTELELTNMTSTFIFLGISIIYLAAHSLFYPILESKMNKFIDVTYHICGALFLFAGGITLIYSAVHIQGTGCDHFKQVWTGPVPKHHFSPLPSFISTSLGSIFSSSVSPFHGVGVGVKAVKFQEQKEFLCHYFGEKIVGGSLNLLNGIVYGFLAVIIHGTNLDEL